MGNETTSRAKDRLDLVKRFFSVAISIGVGTKLVQAGWIRDGRWPDAGEWDALGVILLAIYATVLSWDNYLASVEKKPLNGWFRFAIDIFLVIMYTVLISTADVPWRWLPILCVIFSLYVVWDVASIFEFPNSFVRGHRCGDSRVLAIVRAFTLSVADAPGIDRGPLISLVWAVYFVLIWRIVHEQHPSFSNAWVLSAAGVGLWLYRRDKERRGADGARGFKMWQRTVVIVSLLACALVLPTITLKV
ncbi:hypothetical protein ACVIW2_003537 [Bradyrhizobium huanghuaihaiense]